MGKVIAEITMSLDGFIAGPAISDLQPLGVNGDKLHEWLFGKATPTDKAILEEINISTGAVILGHRTYSTALDGGWAGSSPFSSPAFVLCHTTPSRKVKGFEYITGGIHDALQKAKQAAGDKNSWVMGGANVIQQYVKTGMIEEFRLHIAPVLLMQGTRLFDNIGIEPVEWVKESVRETHGRCILYCVLKDSNGSLTD